LGDPADQPVSVYLPPRYFTDPGRRYPVLYLLHGYTGVPREWTDGYQGMQLDLVMDSLVAAGVGREMIVVVPNGRNKYFGSFYLNSAATGNWEDYLVRDLVAYVDSAYRTLANVASRGIAGHSMGGFGALTLAMRHPDVYHAVYGLSPCCLGLLGDLSQSNPAWRKAIALTSADQLSPDPQSLEAFYVDAMVALSAALSPNPSHKPLLVDFPYRLQDGHLIGNEPAIGRWRTAMPLYAVGRYQANLRRLGAIAFDYGENEEFSHIRMATARFSAELGERGIPHQFEVYSKGTHGDHIRERFETRVVPFFSRALSGQ